MQYSWGNTMYALRYPKLSHENTRIILLKGLGYMFQYSENLKKISAGHAQYYQWLRLSLGK